MHVCVYLLLNSHLNELLTLCYNQIPEKARPSKTCAAFTLRHMMLFNILHFLTQH